MYTKLYSFENRLFLSFFVFIINNTFSTYTQLIVILISVSCAKWITVYVGLLD